MELHRHDASLISLERKRLRDRKAQRTMKEKRESQIRILEERVAFCEKYHGGDWIHQSGPQSSEMESLRRENRTLHTRLESLRQMFDSWGGDTSFEPRERHIPIPGPLTGSRRPTEPLMPSKPQQEATLSAPVPRDFTDTTDGPDIVHLPALHHPIHELPSAIPPWYLVPMNDNGHLPPRVPPLCPWLSRPDLVIASPPHPSPLALLYGTRRNWLADQIHRSIRQRAIRDSECLAVGWLAYNFSKWRVSPNPETFARLATFQRPTLAQLQHGHPVGLDLLPWPQLRSNLAQTWHRYDYAELTGYLSCCMKVRWPWGEEILEPDEDDNMQIRRKFVDVFTCETGLGLTDEFISKFPELLEGMDIETLRFDITLECQAT
ncbi:hypothetical protein P170DRAFT_502878 [Aspergillus steynii IBT 23096]|uniref:BZIP domain-containing protein n=1 Tax=Aspergillus steynii IBT 23096 TaxID=1392250 RepID=A0A2I2FUJ4_9EURO|nr:uncharacterized protein P170DRAFT_502878 [Aspergillus steynii IBT 23096]PLB44236.1 hypothetical protein P170DRAFT_502878 [Aspergillus steynii IBT 23096]